MDVYVHGEGPAAPFLSARDRFETERDVARPVHVQVRQDPDERTRVDHYEDRHELHISAAAATSAMAPELACHEYAHMARDEEAHPSHVQSTGEAVVLALTGESVERRKVVHCHQIANHMKDIYADDITVAVTPGEKLVAFLESKLAAAVADTPDAPPSGAMTAARNGGFQRTSPASDPDITAINAAFALGLVERHDLVAPDHDIYDLAHAAARDAPAIDLSRFKRRFADLPAETDESTYRKALVEVTREYVLGDGGAPAAD